MKKLVKVMLLNVIGILSAILLLSLGHLIIGMAVAKIDGNIVPLYEAVVFCLKTNTKLVLVGLVVISCVYSARKFIRAELDAIGA